MSSESQPPVNAATSRWSALVVDDEGPIRRVVRRFLERGGWAVDEAEDGAAAERLLLGEGSAGAYDLVICDVNLPARSGVELWHLLRAHRPELASRFVLATGESMGGGGRLDVDLARELGAGGRLLAKPFSLDDLARLVRAVTPAAAA